MNKLILSVICLLTICISAFGQAGIQRQPLTTNTHFGPVPTEGQVPIWNDTAKKWSNGLISATGTPHIWTNDNGTLKPIAFPTNILFRVVVPDDATGTNFYFDSRNYRTNAATKLFAIYNGGSNALTIGPNGGLFSGRGNATPFPGAVLYGIFDTALGETNQQELFILSKNSSVGYNGAADILIDTNYSSFILFANKEGGVKFTRFAIQAGGGLNPENFNTFSMQALVDGATYFQVDPSFTLLQPTNYLFSSSVRITNTHTLMSLQNSNFPVLEVDGVGDLRLIKKVPYLWPSSQGAAGTVLTNNGSGTLGWGAVSGGGDTLWTNEAFYIRPVNGSVTNTLKVMTNGGFGIAIGDTNRMNSEFGWPQAGQTFINMMDGTTDHNFNWFIHGVIDANGTGGTFELTESSDPAATIDFDIWTNNLLAVTYEIRLEKQGGYFQLRDSANSNFIAFAIADNAAANVVGDTNMARFTWAGQDRFLIATNGNFGLGGLVYKPPTIQGASGSILTNNGAGILGWGTASGGSVAFSDLVWTNDNNVIKPNAFPTNVLLRVDAADDGTSTNYYLDARTYRANGASKLFALYNGGSNALSIGPFGGLFIGRANFPSLNYVLYATRDTELGEPATGIFTMQHANTAVGYSGAFTFTSVTNRASIGMSSFNGSDSIGGFDVISYFTNSTFALYARNPIGNAARGVYLSPGIGETVPTNYLFNSAYRLTNIHTLFSLQNSNTPMFEVNGIGDLKLLKRVAYSWPSSQGSAQTVLTNDGSGNLGWGAVVLSGPAAITNLFTASLSNDTIKPLVVGVGNAAGATNTTGAIRGLEAGGGFTLTANGSNYVIGGSASFTNLVGTGAITNLNDNQFADETTIASIKNLARITNANFFGATNFGDFTNDGKIFSTGNFTNGGAVNILGGVTNWAGSQFSGTALAKSNLLVRAGQSTSNAWVGGLMFQSTGSFTNLNAAGTMSNLANVIIPAHTMTNSGDAIHAIWRGIMPGALANTNQFQIVFGSQTILDTGLLPASNTVFSAEAWIVRTGNTAQHAEGRLEWGPGGGVSFAFTNANLELVQTNGIDTTLALKGGARRVGAHTNNFFRVWYDPGPN